VYMCPVQKRVWRTGGEICWYECHELKKKITR